MSDHPIDIIGLGADGPASLRPELIERIHAADFLAGGERNLAFFPEVRAQKWVIKDSGELFRQLGKRHQEQRCVVLATGDPLFYSIGAGIATRFGSKIVRVEPALSSMQLAFARAGIPWQDAALGSIHGRNLRENLLPLLGKIEIGLFTQDGDSPAQVARFFIERGLSGYLAVVGENLGTKEERVTRWPDLHPLAEQRFAPLNYLVLRRTFFPASWTFCEMARRRALAPGIPDEEFDRPADKPEVMTRQEVRAVALAKMAGEHDPGDVCWDIGAGLGTVSVELAILRPHVEVLAVERDPKRAEYLRRNRERFDAYNIRVREGTAPEAFAQEQERPRVVFIGGSGERLPAILDLAKERLSEEGRLVANFVTLENLTLTLQRLQDWHWPFEITEVHVSRSDSLAGLTGLKPQRGVFIVRADKREVGHG